MTETQQLYASHIADLSNDQIKAVLGYLNLPPVGGFADVDGPPDTSLDTAFELPAAIRRSVRERRDHFDRFSSPEQLIGIDGFGPVALRAVVDRLSNVGRYGNRLRPVWGGPASMREFFDLLEGAERYIHISTYIIGGEVGLRMAQLLAKKMREGVAVRVLFCASGFVISGSPSGTGFVSRFSELRSFLFNDMYVRKRILRVLREAGVPVINSSPIGRHWKRRSLRRLGIRSARQYEQFARQRGIPDEWLDEQARIDRECGLAFANVDHRKMVIVDGERAFIGSQNIADSYLYENELSPDPTINVRKWQWHDSAAILEGGAVVALNQLFARRWVLSGGDMFDAEDAFYAPPTRRVGNAVVTIDQSIPGLVRLPMKENLPRLLWSMVGADQRPIPQGINPIRERVRTLPSLAQTDLYAAHCYPSDGQLLAHWMEAVPSVPDFTMVVPLHYDTKVLGIECDRFYPEMIAAGAHLWGYDRAIMHTKIAVVDGYYTSLGSYNLTLRSGRADLELQFFVQCPEFGHAVRERIREDLKACKPVRPTALAKYRSMHSIPVFDALVRYFLL
ncbi:MAG: phosphatidylserine/phosphatidylglycerophosphate/cardiolipin synthase family protein [Myxococcota bacterium]|nr:phosphatidylserine/phosphatidylglycerophosphate/cardiolipin synthase family protein [Myxococcota bacterium]